MRKTEQPDVVTVHEQLSLSSYILPHVVRPRRYLYIYIFYEKKRENDSEKSTVKTYKFREKYLKPRDIERRVVKICYNSFWYKVAKGTKWFVRV